MRYTKTMTFFQEDLFPEYESKSMPITDNMGREEFWKDAGRPDYDTGFILEEIDFEQ